MFGLILVAAFTSCANPSIVSAGVQSVTTNGALEHYTIASTVQNRGNYGSRAICSSRWSCSKTIKRQARSVCSRSARSSRKKLPTASIAQPMPATAPRISRSLLISTAGQAIMLTATRAMRTSI